VYSDISLSAPGMVLRPWRVGDEDALVKFAGDRAIWLNMRDLFPHPYTRAHADGWVALNRARTGPVRHFAIEVGGVAVGSCGFDPLDDERRITAEIGYWLAKPHWGKGLATVALARVTRYAFDTLPLERLQAHVYDWNPASARVLEKCGYTLEGRLRRAVIKDGRVGDALVYARLRQGV
jgi:RimJ/RimL family protein N-acetyltransferase